MRLDYFEYAHIKQMHPEMLSQMYTKEEIEILDFIYEKSFAGRDFHNEPYFIGRELWHAIPGGIPPMLVSGVCVNMSDPYFKELQENIEMISICFPNAVIFDENQKVIAYPKNYQHQKSS